ERPNAAAVAKWHEALAGELLDQFEVRSAPLSRGIDVEHHQLVDFFLIENTDGIDRVADIFRRLEAHRLHQSTTLGAEQQARDQPWYQHGRLAKLRISAIPNRWLFSGWNCT